MENLTPRDAKNEILSGMLSRHQCFLCLYGHLTTRAKVFYFKCYRSHVEVHPLHTCGFQKAHMEDSSAYASFAYLYTIGENHARYLAEGATLPCIL